MRQLSSKFVQTSMKLRRSFHKLSLSQLTMLTWNWHLGPWQRLRYQFWYHFDRRINRYLPTFNWNFDISHPSRFNAKKIIKWWNLGDKLYVHKYTHLSSILTLLVWWWGTSFIWLLKTHRVPTYWGCEYTSS